VKILQVSSRLQHRRVCLCVCVACGKTAARDRASWLLWPCGCLRKVARDGAFSVALPAGHGTTVACGKGARDGARWLILPTHSGMVAYRKTALDGARSLSLPRQNPQVAYRKTTFDGGRWLSLPTQNIPKGGGWKSSIFMKKRLTSTQPQCLLGHVSCVRKHAREVKLGGFAAHWCHG